MRLLLAFLLLGGSVAACSSDDVGQRDDGSLVLGGVEVTDAVERGVVPGARTLVVDLFGGTITLSGTSGESARLTFVKNGRGDDPDAARDALGEIRIDEAGDEASYRYALTSGEPARTSVDVTGTVPAGTRLALRLANGTVVVREVAAPLSIRVENGRVQVAAAASDVEATAQNGDLAVAMAVLGGEQTVTLTTQNGRVALGVPATADARVEASTNVGRIVTEGVTFRNQRLDPEAAGARFRGTLGRGTARVTLETQNGSVELADADRLTVLSAAPPAAPADTTRR